ncbi:MAG: radical SAM protein [Vicinamibacteria bacterium]|jgi:putative pyruvate formate lyase activating enzyme|nr:radical SAM protein [Vicinamibacteria bacterium]
MPLESAWLIEDFEPAYLRLLREGRLDAKRDAARARLTDCHACPRDCHVNREAGETGLCRTGRRAIVASAFAHRGEEGCLSGQYGSGTIFFSHCNLRCVFCQNWDISQQRSGEELESDEIAALMLRLEAQGCHNINLVTPEHVVPQVVAALVMAIEKGLRLPVVYNTSGYDATDSLRLLEGLIDIYMPDFKYWRARTAARLSQARDYPEHARAAITEMQRQVGPLRLGLDGLARRGLLVRHLLMPGQLNESQAIFEWLARECSPDTYVNIMGQYRPAYRVRHPQDGPARYAEIARRPTEHELAAAYAAAQKAGLHRFDGCRGVS